MLPCPFLEVSAMEWLRYVRNCHVVMLERGQGTGRPDVLAVNARRFLTEVEVKRSLSDFRRDALKPQRQNPRKHAPQIRQLYYSVPPELVEKVQPILPPDCGLLTLSRQLSGFTGLPETVVVVPAAIRAWAKPVTEERLWTLVRDMAASAVTAECAYRRCRAELAAATARDNGAR